MARRVFFSFDYQFAWKVNIIRNMPSITGTAAAGFEDARRWDEAEKSGANSVRALIDAALEDTTVTVVCVTYGFTSRTWTNYEIEKSLERGSGLVAVQLHEFPPGSVSSPGAIPRQIQDRGFKAYKYTNKGALANWIEEAAKIAGR